MPVIADDIYRVDTAQLIPYTNNPKEHPDEQVQKIASSIKNYGWDQPIVIDGDGEIIKGHGRLQAADLLDLEEVPVIERTDLSDAEKRASRIADNKTAESDWHEEDLSLELELLQEEDFDLGLTGFDDDEIGDLLDQENEENLPGDNKYTDKIETPVYEPTGDKPDLGELFDAEKYHNLIDTINSADIPDEKAEFLRYAAQRHIVFDYENIAEYFAHEDAEMQELMEALTLVIVDYDQAVEQGFVRFADTMLGGEQ